MHHPFQRTERLKSLFERELLTIFRSSLKEPILEGVSIQIIDILLAKDLSSAKVYVSLLEKSKEVAAIEALQKKAYLIQGLLGKKMRLKKIPKFYFIQDDSIAKASYINAILDNLKDDKES